MAADREWLTPAETAAREGGATHHLIEEAPTVPVEHISDDGLRGLCGESLVVDVPTGPTCPACAERAGRARYVWPRVAPLVLALIWVVAMCVGRYVTLWDFTGPQRMAASVLSMFALVGVVALAGRVRPVKQGGDPQS